jgi:hypothetical protein
VVRARRAALVFWLVLPLGCASVVYQNGPGGPTTRDSTVETTLHYFIFGAVGRPELDVGALCREKTIDKIQVLSSVPNVIVTVLTLGIYAPRTVRVWCSL